MDVDAFLKYGLGEYITHLAAYVVRLITLNVAALGMVYMFGRMLLIARSHLSRNIIAILTTFMVSFWMQTVFWWEGYSNNYRAYHIVIFSIVSFVTYVWFFWRAFDRVDTWLDNKNLRDKSYTDFDQFGNKRKGGKKMAKTKVGKAIGAAAKKAWAKPEVRAKAKEWAMNILTLGIRALVKKIKARRAKRKNKK